MLLVGAATAGDYGVTVDDTGLWEYRHHTRLIYREAFQGHFSFSPGPDNLRYYGPAFLTVTDLVQDLVLAISPQAEELTIWHFLVFASFVAGLPALYYIARLLFKPHVAIGVVLIYATQPLLWGHAFINGKDTPFLSFFLISVATGLRMDQRVQTVWPKPAKTKPRAAMRAWSNIRPKLAWALVVLSVASLLQLAFPNWPEGTIRGILNQAVQDASSFWGILFDRLAANANTVPLESYVQKALLLTQTASQALLAAGWVALITAAVLKWPPSRTRLQSWWQTTPWRTARKYLADPVIWAAGAALAFTWAIRVTAPFAAVLVALFLLARKGLGAIPALLVYGLIACLGTFLLWPYLWESPIGHMLESLLVMSDFPLQHTQLLNGHFYLSTSPPFYVLPELVAIQFTLPAIGLMLAGGFLLRKNWASQNKVLVSTLLLWVGLPSAYSILLTPTQYNNFRQWLFILPPLFLLAGYALQALDNLLTKRPLAYWFALFLGLLPGLWSIISLHPYQYIYYNELVGGVRGASGRFELDYWATAMRPAMEELNQIAPSGSRVVVWASLDTARHFAREDLLVEYHLHSRTYDLETGYHYAMIQLGSTLNTSTPYPDGLIVVSIEREGIPLAIVKQLKPPPQQGN